ncbi:hypothetical protein B7494_g6593 [Chlorociboria aeruginascens]|nr:hypothetical protein B7494_g6593 [Chlorociboria aeruginascens]
MNARQILERAEFSELQPRKVEHERPPGLWCSFAQVNVQQQESTLLLESQSITNPPPWYKIIGAVPPSEILTRPQPTQLRDQHMGKKARKPSKMFKPHNIRYEEDELREQFYSDHPWELARPRIVLENDGKDGQRCDWSSLRQRGRPLDGESVVQRQLWLLHNAPELTPEHVYDIARKEFYELRHEEEVERRVAKEEAMYTGAYFGKSALKVGMELEDETYEGWKVWATKEYETMVQQREAAYTGIGTANEDDGLVPGETEEAVEDVDPVPAAV